MPPASSPTGLLHVLPPPQALSAPPDKGVGIPAPSPLPVPRPPPPSTEDTPLAPPPTSASGQNGPGIADSGACRAFPAGAAPTCPEWGDPWGVGAGCRLPAALLETCGLCDQPPSLPSSRGHCCSWETCPSPLGFVSLSHLCNARAPGAGSQLRTVQGGAPVPSLPAASSGCPLFLP